MIKFFILIPFVFLHTCFVFAQSNNYDGVVTSLIWTSGRSHSYEGEKNFNSFSQENIVNLPENVKLLLIGIASFSPADFSYKNQLARVMGYESFKKAQDLWDKLYPESMNIKNIKDFSNHLTLAFFENKILFFTNSDESNVLVFEANKKKPLVLIEQYDQLEMHRIETPKDLKARIRYEKSKQANREEGVEINGLLWSTRNVGSPNKFVRKPENSGMHYQFNRKNGWDAFSTERWDHTLPEGSSWEKINDPCPDGWRVPTTEELKTLMDSTKVESEWIDQNNIRGMKFTDKQTKKFIFLPLAGCRNWGNGTLNKSEGRYWSCEQKTDEKKDSSDGSTSKYMNYLYFDSIGTIFISNWSPNIGFSVRCISE